MHKPPAKNLRAFGSGSDAPRITPMKKEHIFLGFALFFTLLSFYLLYQILSPFLTSILWAVLLAMVFYPLFKKLLHLLKGRKILSAIIMTLLVLAIIVLPFSFLMASLALEAVDVYHQVEGMITNGSLQTYLKNMGEIPFLKTLWLNLNQYFDLSQVDPQGLFLKNLQQISAFMFNQTSVIVKGFSTFVITFFFTVLSLYYLFKDGDRLFEWLKEIVPFSTKGKTLILKRLQDMIYATIYGGILIALIQGLLGGLSFWVLGLSSPIFWGTTMALLSFIPMGGTAIIWFPASIYLFIQGAILKGMILLGLGIFVISMVDNLLRPFFISSRTNIHPLLLFFAVLGGIQYFGFIGLVAGPLIATLFLALVEIYIEGIKPSE
jgi:predicted PurR-regulated permease PerM